MSMHPIDAEWQAKCDRLSAEVARLRQQVDNEQRDARELRAKLARVQALIDDSLDARHGAGGCGIYAYSLREALR